MALDQVHEQNNRTIKFCGGATGLVNNVEKSALIRWETCGPEVARIINEFEESMKLETPEEDDSNLHLHHEDSATYRKKLSSDVKTLCKSMTINPFSQTKLMTINNSHVIPNVVFDTLKKMEEVGEKQLIDFLNDRLIYQKVSICLTIPKNNFCIWYTPKIDTKKPFTPSNSEITKMRNACEHRPEIAKIVFGNEIWNVPQSLGKSYNTMYHGSKSELTKRFSKYSINEIPKNAEKSDIIIEISPLICAKCSQKAGMACFSDLAIILYYEIMRLGFDYNRIDTVLMVILLIA